MKLEEAKKVLNVFYGRCKNCTNEEYCDGCYIDAEDVEAISTVLQELDHLQKDSINKENLIEIIDFAINATDSNDDYSIGMCNGMLYIKSVILDKDIKYKKRQKNKKEKPYEFGLIVGTKRERDWWQNKIREKIEELKSKILNEADYFRGKYYEYAIDVLQNLLKEE